MDFKAEDKNTLDKLISHYSKNYEISYNIDLAGMTVPVMAKMEIREQMSILGFSINKIGKRASEYVFFLSEESFGRDEADKVRELLDFAEKEYVIKDTDHAYTFLSAVVLSGNIEEPAVKALKRYKLFNDYGANGWVLARAAAYGQDGDCWCSKDGGDLKKLIKGIISQ